MDTLLITQTARLDVDFINRVLTVRWKGNVEIEDYQRVLTKAVEISEAHEIRNIIIDRLQLKELNTECRVWMKEVFLKLIAKPIIPKLKKVATIESKSTIGQIYTNTITKTVSLVYPNLKFRSFKDQDEALEWMQLKHKTSKFVEETVGSKKPAEKASDAFFERIFSQLFKPK